MVFWSNPVLGGSQMMILFLTRFSQWEPIDTFKCENRTENWPQVLTWSRTGSNVYIFFWEKQSGSLLELRSGSQSYLYHLLVPLVLLLTWDCYSSPVAIIFSPLLLFFSCCCSFSHMVLLFPCDEVIKLLKKILVNENFNNQVVKTRCENWLLLYIWEPTYLRTRWVWK
jgi:hypothetical protein